MDKTTIIIIYCLFNAVILSIWTYETIKNYTNMRLKLYGKTLMFKRGLTVNLNITFRCNLKCPYCNNLFSSGEVPKTTDSTFEEWKDFFDRWPYKYAKVREIAILGGEPALYDDLVPVVNYLLNRGFHVKIYTNLTKIDKYKQIKPSHHFRLTASYHKVFDVEKFKANYFEIREYHDIIVQEIGEKTLPFSISRPLQTSSNDQHHHIFSLDPERCLFLGCVDMTMKRFYNKPPN